MKIFELTHNPPDKPIPGVALRMIVAVRWHESTLDARLLAAQKRGLESEHAWLDPAASTCRLICFGWGNVDRGVRCVQKAEAPK